METTSAGPNGLRGTERAGEPAESFPFDQSQERYRMYALEAYGLPEMYWNGMHRGRA